MYNNMKDDQYWSHIDLYGNLGTKDPCPPIIVAPQNPNVLSQLLLVTSFNDDVSTHTLMDTPVNMSTWLDLPVVLLVASLSSDYNNDTKTLMTRTMIY